MKRVLVTGAHKGLGLAWCRAFALRRYEVVLTARNSGDAQAAAHRLAEEGLAVIPQTLDVTEEASIKALLAWFSYEGKGLDVLINNAGINPKDYRDKTEMAKAFYLDSLEAEALMKVFHINSIAPLLMVKHFRPLLKQSPRPVVLSVSSWLGSVSQLTFGGHYGYVASKNLLNVLHKSMALELKLDGIVCATVNPGWVQTDMGGGKAPLTPDASVNLVLEHVFDRLSLEQSGGFFHYDGAPHPW
jgi:NAD(P)-dependent dehydrogenase (short-subunit alcohol dehydrogenase family)